MGRQSYASPMECMGYGHRPPHATVVFLPEIRPTVNVASLFMHSSKQKSTAPK